MAVQSKTNSPALWCKRNQQPTLGIEVERNVRTNTCFVGCVLFGCVLFSCCLVVCCLVVCVFVCCVLCVVACRCVSLRVVACRCVVVCVVVFLRCCCVFVVLLCCCVAVLLCCCVVVLLCCCVVVCWLLCVGCCVLFVVCCVLLVVCCFFECVFAPCRTLCSPTRREALSGKRLKLNYRRKLFELPRKRANRVDSFGPISSVGPTLHSVTKKTESAVLSAPSHTLYFLNREGHCRDKDQLQPSSYIRSGTSDTDAQSNVPKHGQAADGTAVETAASQLKETTKSF